MKRRAIVRLTNELIHDMLGLDGDHEVIVSVTDIHDVIHNRVQILVSGPSAPQVPEGNVPPVMTVDNGRLV